MLRNRNQSFSGKRVLGTPKTGVLGRLIPSTGDSGPGFAYPSLSLPADNNTEISGWITEFPVGGTLIAYEDTSFTFSGPDGYYTFNVQIKANGASVGPPITISLLVGAGVHSSNANLVSNSASMSGACSRVSAVMTLTTADITAIVRALHATLIPVNVKEVNDGPITGIGTQDNPWGPA